MKTADPELMRAINRFHVMDAIRRRGAISRVEITEATELSAATVSAITAALLDDGLIFAQRLPVSSEAARGRPRVMLALNPKAAHVVGVKLAPRRVSIAVTDFVAAPLATLEMPVRTERQPLAVIADLVEDGVRHCVADASLTMPSIHGVCVGVPGVVETRTGVCWRSPIFGPGPAPFAVELTNRLGVATKLESDVTLMMLAEHWFGHGRDLDSFIVVSVEHSVGIGLLLNGEPYRGVHGLSPDLGWYSLGSGEERVTLESRVSEAALLDGASALGKAAGYRGRLATMEDLVAAAVGEPWAQRLLEEAGRALGQALANLASILAPPRIIISGRVMAAGSLLTDALRRVFESERPAALAGRNDLIIHHWGDDVWARGAASLVLRDLYGATWNTSGPRLLAAE
jgi:predicted NBD/HSP70 family sugar kinase